MKHVCPGFRETHLGSQLFMTGHSFYSKNVAETSGTHESDPCRFKGRQPIFASRDHPSSSDYPVAEGEGQLSFYVTLDQVAHPFRGSGRSCKQDSFSTPTLHFHTSGIPVSGPGTEGSTESTTPLRASSLLPMCASWGGSQCPVS